MLADKPAPAPAPAILVLVFKIVPLVEYNSQDSLGETNIPKLLWLPI
jgi:hypothetical protein